MRKNNICGRDGAAGTGRPGRDGVFQMDPGPSRFWVGFIETYVFICGNWVGMTRDWPRMCLGMILVLGISWKVYFGSQNWICWPGILEILEHQSFWLTSEPVNTGTPVGNDTVAVFWYIVLFIFGKVTFWDLLDMFRFKKWCVCLFLVFVGHVQFE